MAVRRLLTWTPISRQSDSSGPRPVADPVARAGTESSGAVARIRELAAVEREAAAADALGEAEPQALELGDTLVDSRRPSGREACPVAAGGRLIGGKLRELGAYLLERQACPLREDDERDSAEHRPWPEPARSELIRPRCS
jgi:hypothetical protein